MGDCLFVRVLPLTAGLWTGLGEEVLCFVTEAVNNFSRGEAERKVVGGGREVKNWDEGRDE